MSPRKGILEKPPRVLKTCSNGKLIKGRKKLDSFVASFNYSGLAVWEGIRAYQQKDGSTKLFKLKEHIKRLFNSARIIGIKLPFEAYELERACQSLVMSVGGGDLYLRPIAYVDSDCEEKFDIKTVSIDIHCFEVLYTDDRSKKAIISSHSRSYPEYIMQAKTPANYNKIFEMKAEAERAGVEEVLITDRHGYVVEGSTSNILVIKGNIIATPPSDGSILPGITLNELTKILHNPTIFVKHKRTPNVVVKNITRADIYTADSILLTGTLCEIINICEIDGRPLLDKNENFYYKILRDEFTKLTRGIK